MRFEPNSQLFAQRRHTFSLFQRGRRQDTANCITGSRDGSDVEIFELKYVTGRGKHTKHHRLSVIALKDSRCSFPHFSVEPENFFHRVGTMFGMQDINFEEYPEFSKAFRLTGSAEPEIRAVFSPEVVRTMLERQALAIEAAGDTMLLFIPKKRLLKIEEIEQALTDCLMVKSAFSRR